MGEIPHPRFHLQIPEEIIDGTVTNMLVMQDQLAVTQCEIRLEVGVLLRIEIVFDIVVESERQNDFINIELFPLAKIKQILLIRAITRDTAINDFLIRPANLRSAEEFGLICAHAPDIRITQHNNSFSIGCPFELDIIGSPQTELILMVNIWVMIFGVSDILNRCPPQLVIEAAEPGLFVDCNSKSGCE